MRLDFQNVIPRKTVDGNWEFEVVGVPFGGHLNGKDAQGEFFTPETDIMLQPGDERPVIYYHGYQPSGTEDPHPVVMGKAIYKGVREGVGHIFDVIIDKTKKFADRIWKAAIMGLARASGGSVPHLVRKNEATGELSVWPLAELTLVDQGQGRLAANQFATVSLKTVYEEADIELPQGFVEEALTSEAEPETKEAESEPEDKRLKIGGIPIRRN